MCERGIGAEAGLERILTLKTMFRSQNTQALDDRRAEGLWESLVAWKSNMEASQAGLVQKTQDGKDLVDSSWKRGRGYNRGGSQKGQKQPAVLSSVGDVVVKLPAGSRRLGEGILTVLGEDTRRRMKRTWKVVSVSGGR